MVNSLGSACQLGEEVDVYIFQLGTFSGAKPDRATHKYRNCSVAKSNLAHHMPRVPSHNIHQLHPLHPAHSKGRLRLRLCTSIASCFNLASLMPSSSPLLRTSIRTTSAEGGSARRSAQKGAYPETLKRNALESTAKASWGDMLAEAGNTFQ